MTNRDTRANGIVYGAATGAAVAGAANPIPLAGDVAILVTAWGAMLVGLAGVYDADFDRRAFAVAARQSLFSVGAYLAGTLTFIYALKFTGVGTPAAAIANAVLNFGFTMGVGFMYKDAWKSNRDPSVDELQGVVKEMAEELVHHLKGEERKELVRIYRRARRKGSSHREAIMEVIQHVFPDRFEEGEDSGRRG